MKPHPREEEEEDNREVANHSEVGEAEEQTIEAAAEEDTTPEVEVAEDMTLKVVEDTSPEDVVAVATTLEVVDVVVIHNPITKLQRIAINLPQ